MKKLILFVSALAISTIAFCQDFTAGPKFKNAEIGKINLPKITLVHDSKVSTVKGPTVKNDNVWKKEDSKKIQVGFRDEINNPKGLKAKNSNPWDKATPKTETKAAYQEPKSMRPKKAWLH
jgi:hypothetical protein